MSDQGEQVRVPETPTNLADRHAQSRAGELDSRIQAGQGAILTLSNRPLPKITLRAA